MASVRLETKSTSIEKTRIFALPGILGHESDFMYIKPYLDALQPERTIRTWTDPRLDRKNLSLFDLQNIAQIIADGITKILPPNAPCQIIGYSFGAILLSEVITQLKKKGRIVHAYCLDASPPKITKNYFSSGKMDATHDLIAICGSLAMQLKKKPHHPIYSEEALRTLNALPIQKQLTNISQDYREFNLDISRELLDRIEVVKQNIHALFNYELSTHYQPDAFRAAMTTETLRKYDAPEDGGWRECYGASENLTYTILPGTHLSLIQDASAGGQAKIVAEDINHFFINALKLQAKPLTTIHSLTHNASTPIIIPTTPTKTERKEIAVDSFSSSPPDLSTQALISKNLLRKDNLERRPVIHIALTEEKHNTLSPPLFHDKRERSLSPAMRLAQPHQTSKYASQHHESKSPLRHSSLLSSEPCRRRANEEKSDIKSTMNFNNS